MVMFRNSTDGIKNRHKSMKNKVKEALTTVIIECDEGLLDI